jgi:hypothetical protein
VVKSRKAHSDASTVDARLGAGKRGLGLGRSHDSFGVGKGDYHVCSPFASPFYADTRPY